MASPDGLVTRRAHDLDDAPAGTREFGGPTSGPYGAAVAVYAAAGIATFPVGGASGKKPLVKRPAAFGVRASRAIAAKHSDANIAMWCGPRIGISVLDIDTADRRELEWALEMFGPSPVIVRTGSGKHHAWYRHNGEGRRIRPIAGHPIDLLGANGLCVLPPSVHAAGGRYEFVEGGLSDLWRLPCMRSEAIDALDKARHSAAQPRTGGEAPSAHDEVEAPDYSPHAIREGWRNKAIFSRALWTLKTGASFDAALADGMAFNAARCAPPLGDAEVVESVRSAAKYQDAGRNWVGGAQRLVVSAAEAAPLMEAGEGDAFLLYGRLRMAHGGLRPEFSISPHAMARSRVLGNWSAPRYRRSTAVLIDFALIERIHRGGRGAGDPDLYRFTTGREG